MMLCSKQVVNKYSFQSNIHSNEHSFRNEYSFGNERIFVQSFRTNIRYIRFSPNFLGILE